jgi:hypothetical protein
MNDQDPFELTNQERFILNYYRTSEFVGTERRWLYDGATFAASLACLIYAFATPDPAFSFVAYGLLAARLIYLVSEGRRWSAVFRSLFAKYDARVKELKAAVEQKDKSS